MLKFLTIKVSVTLRFLQALTYVSLVNLGLWKKVAFQLINRLDSN